MRRILCSLALGAFALSIQAATLVPSTFPSGDPSFTATLDLIGGTLNLATPSGPDTLSVFDDLNNFVGNVIATDGGTPGHLVLTVNGGASEGVAFTFDTTTAHPVGSSLVIDATGAPFTAITDPGLALLIGAASFNFATTGSQESPFVFDLSFATLPTSTPEPAVAFTVGIGLFAISALRLRKR